MRNIQKKYHQSAFYMRYCYPDDRPKYKNLMCKKLVVSWLLLFLGLRIVQQSL